LWQQAIGGTYRADLIDTDPLDFCALVDVWNLGDMLLTHSRLPAVQFTRSPGKIAEDRGDYYVFLYLISGDATGDFDGRITSSGAGSITAIDMTRPFSSRGAASDSISVSIHRNAIDQALRTSPDLHGMAMQGPLAQLLADHIISVENILPATSTSDAAIIAKTTAQVAASCIAASTNTENISGSLLTFAVRRNIQRYVEKNLHDESLGPETIFKALGLSRSNAYRAFAGTEGIADYVQKQRLIAARRLLLHPDEHRAIAEIAAAVGYSDAALFSRAFRRMFGQSPRETRSLIPSDRAAVELNGIVNSGNFAQWISDLQTHLARDSE
jgi:AraC-like DNA-binding protein